MPPALSQNGKPALVLVAIVVALVVALVFVLKPSTGKLVVTVAGPGDRPIDNVEVLVDGKVVCKVSPCSVKDLSAGTHFVQARAAGYQDTTKTGVSITSGGEAVSNFALLPRTGTGIRVKAAGTGLKLFLDGREVGPLPQELKDLTAGEHLVRVSGDHFEPWEQKVEVKADEMQTIGPLELKVVKGLAMIKDGGNASGARIVLQSGADRRSLPKLPINLYIDTSKSNTLTASKRGFDTFKQELVFSPGQAERTFEITFKERPKPADVARQPKPARAPAPQKSPTRRQAPAGEGTLSFNTIPASKVFLDGRAIGTTPKKGVTVKAGRHGVVFVRDDKKVSKSISIKTGESKTVTHRF